MTSSPPEERLTAAYQTALSALLAERNADGYWTGELSTSALSTATAVGALALVQKHSASNPDHSRLIAGGLKWLVANQNADGGWGDTVKSLSNISTSMLSRAAFHLAGAAEANAECLRRAEAYLHAPCGKTPEEQAEAIRARYGKDRTFAVPILTTCALAGLVDWREVQPLPFELACLPQSWFRFVRLHVVSYALPALIAIGQAVYHHRPPWNPVTRLVRRLAIKRSLRVLEAIQPSSGGFLEATPLTSFVTLSLAGIGLADHPVAKKAVVFLRNGVRPDGSWPIDSNLSTWVTTLSINALAAAGSGQETENTEGLIEWLLAQQFGERHAYTGADPGGWGWTDLPGSVPDADDTPGALLALWRLGESLPSGLLTAMMFERLLEGSLWLMNLQNRDSGWPTFCRGWSNLPFDRSGPDLTAHALRCSRIWLDESDSGWLQRYKDAWKESWEEAPFGKPTRAPWRLLPRVTKAIRRGFHYLESSQRPNGSWLPLWFGNQRAPNDENPTYGTARVLAAYRDLDRMDTEPARRGVAWLLSAQNAEGGWGGAVGVPSSVEETALAVEALLDAGPDAEAAVNKGLAWLVERVEAGGLHEPTPIGFYFAKLWYFEKLYPIIFTVAALGRARKKQSEGSPRPAAMTTSPEDLT